MDENPPYTEGFMNGQLYLGNKVLEWLRLCTELSEQDIEKLDQNISEWRKDAKANSLIYSKQYETNSKDR